MAEQNEAMAQPDEVRVVYSMEWRQSKRHKNPYSCMVFAREKDTRWGHFDPLCDIKILLTPKNSNMWKSALKNTKLHLKNKEDKKTWEAHLEETGVDIQSWYSLSYYDEAFEELHTGESDEED